jgi:hypothetical protein
MMASTTATITTARGTNALSTMSIAADRKWIQRSVLSPKSKQPAPRFTSGMHGCAVTLIVAKYGQFHFEA